MGMKQDVRTAWIANIEKGMLPDVKDKCTNMHAGMIKV